MSYADIFSQFEALTIMVVGDVMIDSYWWADVRRISPEAPVPVCEVKEKENRLGGAANVALNIAAMGAKPLLCSVVGNDKTGLTLRELFVQHGLSAEGLVASEQRPTSIKTRIIGNNTQMLRIDEEDSSVLSEKEQEMFLERVKTLFDNNRIDALVFQDYDKGVLSREVIERITALAHSKSVPVCVDPKKRNFAYYKDADLFKPNFKELKEGLKSDEIKAEEQSLMEAAKLLYDKMNVQKVFVTLSERGVFLADFGSKDRKSVLLPACVRKIADVSGAGDTVISLASLCMALHLQAEQVAHISNIAGGLVCEYVGVVPIDKTRLLTELEKA